MEISVLKLEFLRQILAQNMLIWLLPRIAFDKCDHSILLSHVAFFNVTLILLSWLWGLYRIFLGLSGLGTHLCTVKCRDDF